MKVELSEREIYLVIGGLDVMRGKLKKKIKDADIMHQDTTSLKEDRDICWYLKKRLEREK